MQQDVGINDFNEDDLSKVNGTEKKYSEKDEAEARVASANYAAYVYARDNGHLDYIRDAKKFEDFYFGDQWDEADRKILKSTRRPCLTINKILPTVNAMLGAQLTREVNANFLPVRDASAETAKALNKLYLHVKHSNDLSRLRNRQFADGIIQERGFIDLRMNFDTNTLGDIEAKVVDPIDVWISPEGKEYDPNTWPEVGTTRWMSPDDIRAEYGDEAFEKVKNGFASIDVIDVDAFEISGNTFGGDPNDRVLVDIKGTEHRLKRIRVIDRQYYKFERCRVFIDPDMGDVSVVPREWSKERAEQVAQQAGVHLTMRTMRKIRWTVTAADKIVLHDDWSPYRTYTIIPYFPYFRRGRPMGAIRNLISPQEQLNKSESQVLHIVNTTANSGYYVEEGALHNMTADDLRSKGAETGVVISLTPGGLSKIKKIEPNRIPDGIAQISQRSDQNIKEISSVNDAMLATENARVSGVALTQRISQGLKQLEEPFSNLERTDLMVAKKILELIQDFMTEERVFHIINDIDSEPTEELVINQITAAGKIVNDVTLGKYEIVINSQPSRMTYAETQFAYALELREAGVIVPDDAIVELSPLDGKREIAARIRELQGTAPPTPEQLQAAQVQQDIAVKAQILELQKQEQEIAVFAADAQLKVAKAMTEIGQDERAFAELEAEIQKKREEYQLRYDLAELAAASKERINALKVGAQHTEEHLKRVEERIREARAAAQARQPQDNISSANQEKPLTR